MTSENILDHASDAVAATPEDPFSTSLRDMYHKVGSLISEHPKTSAAAVVGTVAVIAAAEILSHGEALPGLIEAGEKDAPVTSLLDGLGTKATDAMDPFKVFDQSTYKFVPMRSLVTGIRTGDGAALRSVEGQSRIVLGGDNSVQHILINKGAGPEARADLLMQAGYAGILKNDVLAAKAAGKMGDGTFGFLSRTVDGSATPAEIQERAIAGARAYVGMDAKAANPFTSYLTERFGPMTKETQAWGRHIINTPESPESPWNIASGPATDSLVQYGLPISPLNRAVAANPSVMKAEPWLRASAIKGGAKYLEAKAAQALPEDTSAMVKDVWYGVQATAMPPEVVKTIGNVSLAMGPEASANTAIIDKVAAMLYSKAQPEEYVGAYNALAEGEGLVETLAKMGR